jgi:hypothetical protein
MVAAGTADELQHPGRTAMHGYLALLQPNCSVPIRAGTWRTSGRPLQVASAAQPHAGYPVGAATEHGMMLAYRENHVSQT